MLEENKYVLRYGKLSDESFLSNKSLLSKYFQLGLLFLQPQMDEKIQLGPRAQVTWVKGSSGGAKASDSGNRSNNNRAVVIILYLTN